MHRKRGKGIDVLVTGRPRLFTSLQQRIGVVELAQHADQLGLGSGSRGPPDDEGNVGLAFALLP